jgi:hypothetical protein
VNAAPFRSSNLRHLHVATPQTCLIHVSGKSTKYGYFAGRHVDALRLSKGHRDRVQLQFARIATNPGIVRAHPHRPTLGHPAHDNWGGTSQVSPDYD